jgi:hypothetical protein
LLDPLVPPGSSPVLVRWLTFVGKWRVSLAELQNYLRLSHVGRQFERVPVRAFAP